MLKYHRMCYCLLVGLLILPLSSLASIPVKSMVVFGDSLSDIGNTTHLLKSLRQEEDPAFLVAPFKAFVMNKMIDYADEFYVPQIALDTGLAVVSHFFDNELAPYITHLVAQVKLVPVLPGRPYWKSRFSNGRVWNEYLAQMWSIPKEDEDSYLNQSFSGSWATTYDYQLTAWNLIRHPIGSIKSLIVGKLVPPSLGLSVQSYLLDHPVSNEESVFFIFSGGNDYLNVLAFEKNYEQASMSQYIDNVIEGLNAAVLKIKHSGGARFVIMGLPHLGDIPKFIHTTDREVLNAATDSHNERLRQRVEAWKASYPECDFLFIDTQDYMARAASNPQEFGFANTTDACIDITFPMLKQFAPSLFANNFVLQYAQVLQYQDKRLSFGERNFQVCRTPNDYLFWDAVHPSTRAHHHLAVELCMAMKAHGYDVSCSKHLSPSS